MGMSTYVLGLKPPDAKWREMKAVWDACKAAKIDPPAEVWKFFERTDAALRVNGETTDVSGSRSTSAHGARQAPGTERGE